MGHSAKKTTKRPQLKRIAEYSDGNSSPPSLSPRGERHLRFYVKGKTHNFLTIFSQGSLSQLGCSFPASRARRQRFNDSQQRRLFLFQGIQINLLVVRSTSLPAAKQDANPLVSQGPQGSMVTFAPSSQLLIESLGPATVLAGMSGKLVPALPLELGTSHAPVHPAAAAALFGDRSNPPVGEHLPGLLPAVSLGAKSSPQAGGQD